jgi:hypothetical protein
MLSRGRRARLPLSQRDDRRATRACTVRRADVGDAASQWRGVASLLAVAPSIWAQDFGCEIQSARGRGRCARSMRGCYISVFTRRHVLSAQRGSATRVAESPSTVPRVVRALSPRRRFESKFLHTFDLGPPWEPISYRALTICDLTSDPPMCPSRAAPQLGADGPKSRTRGKTSVGPKTGSCRVCDA